jgi:NADH-quinone oxidoreductase subunit M
MTASGSSTPGLLTGLVLAPLAAAIVVASLGALAGRLGRHERAPSGIWRAVGQAFSAAVLVVGAVGLWAGFDPEGLGFQMVERVEWLPQYGFHLHLAVDGLSLFPVLLVLFIVPVAGWMAPSQVERATPGAVARVLVMQSFVLGVLLSVNVMQIFVFWLWLMLPTFFVITSWGGPSPLRAGFSWLMPAVLGSALMLFVLIVVHRLGYEQLGVWVFDLAGEPSRAAPELLDVVIAVDGPWWASQAGLFTAFLVALAVRMRAFPFHVWSVAATEAAPSEGLVLLDGLQGVVGVFLLVRLGLPLFPDGAANVAPIAIAVAVVGLVYGGLVAGAQRDLRQLQGFAQTAALGLTSLGVFTLGEHGIVGGLLQTWSVCLASAAFLVLVGMLVERRGSTALETYGGLAKPMPVFSMLLAVALLSISGIPGSLGFVSELLVLAGGFAQVPVLALVALVGVLLLGACLNRGFRAVALGPVRNPENRGLIDLSWRERLVVLVLLVPLVGFGVNPNPVLRRLEPAVLEVLHVMELRRQVLAVPLEGQGPSPMAGLGDAAEGRQP